uniref:Uncharacterized protein n=1 Tax=Arundo donax TaxID=35708 RepID=A0A0A8Z1P7_ARUDO
MEPYKGTFKGENPYPTHTHTQSSTHARHTPKRTNRPKH